MLSDLIARYERAIEKMVAANPLHLAMESAVGGDFELVGNIELDLLRKCGLTERHSIIDIGCGSGRLAIPLGKHMPGVTYLGTDVIQSLLDYAKTLTPPHFRYVLHKAVGIPADDSSADFVVAFSVFTHLFYEQSFGYLTDAVRVLKPGGTIVFSFLEMEKHWQAFEWARTKVELPNEPLNMFMERSTVETWAKKLDLRISDYMDMGQTAVVLRKTTGHRDDFMILKNGHLTPAGHSTSQASSLGFRSQP